MSGKLDESRGGRHMRHWGMVTTGGLIGLVAFLALGGDALAGKRLYDSFPGDRINENNWVDMEFVRTFDIVNQRLISKVGTKTGNARNTMGLANPGAINSIEANVAVVRTEVDTGNNTSVAARIEGVFYNTQPAGGATGDIYANVSIGKAGGALEARYTVVEVLA